MDDYKYLFKIVLVGNAGVGKTCLVRQFTQGVAPNGHQGATIGVDFMIKNVTVNGVKVKLQLWDTAGQERFRSITQSYYRSAHCLILVYDISSQPSFDALIKWIRDVDGVLGPDSQVVRVLVGNKSDKEREVPYSIGEKFSDIKKFDLFMETSALSNDSVERLFLDVAEILTLRKRDDPTTIINNNNNNNNEDKLTRQQLAQQSGSERNNQYQFGSNLIDYDLVNRAKNCFQC